MNQTASRYKWIALGLLWVAFFLQQGTRQIYGPSLASIMSSTGADAVSAGLVGTVFTLVYGICVPFAGLTADLFSRKWMVTVGVGVFCLGIFLSGFVPTIGLLMVTYGLLNGFGQTFYYPSATSLVSQLHKESRATAMSILQLGLYLGIVGCGGLAGWLAGWSADGWRWAFRVLGGLGLVWAVVLLFFLKDTRPAMQNAAQEKPRLRDAVHAVVANPAALCLAGGLGMMIYVDVGFKIWMPDYLAETFGISKGSAGLNAVLWHYLGAAAGIAIGSRFSDCRVARRPSIRMEVNILGLAGAIPFILWMAGTDSFVCCCTAMGLFGFFRGIYDSNLMAAFLDVVNPRYHASGCGIMMCIAFIFGSLSPTVLGLMKEHVSMSVGIGSLAGFYTLGVGIILCARHIAFKH